MLYVQPKLEGYSPEGFGILYHWLPCYIYNRYSISSVNEWIVYTQNLVLRTLHQISELSTFLIWKVQSSEPSLYGRFRAQCLPYMEGSELRAFHQGRLLALSTNSLPSSHLLISCPDPTHKGKGSGDTNPNSWAHFRIWWNIKLWLGICCVH